MQTHGSPNSKATLPVTKPFHPGDAAQGRSCPRNRTKPGPQPIWNKQCHGQQSPSTSSSSSSSFSCCQAASRAGFLFISSLSFYFLCHFFFDSGWIAYWRGCLGTQSLMQEKKKADLEAHRSVMVGQQCRLKGSSGACFIFRCQGYTHTHNAHKHTQRIIHYDRTCEEHANVCHSFTLLINIKSSYLLPLLYQVWFCLFFVFSVFAFVWLCKHTQRSWTQM